MVRSKRRLDQGPQRRSSGKRREARSRRRNGTIQGVVLVEIVNRDVTLREMSNRVDNDAVRPNNKDRSMG